MISDGDLIKANTICFQEPFAMESGNVLPEVTVTYETYGNINASADNVILILHALTGDAHVAQKHSYEDKLPGWWDEIIGTGKAIDTAKYFVVCSNVLGSCYGSTGPISINPVSEKEYGMDFPTVTIRDMVRLQKKLLDYLGVRRLKAAIGGSMGGMQVLEWGIMYPDFIDFLIPIATSARLTAQCMAFNRVQREAITNDPYWNSGNYYHSSLPSKGLALAREIATITYKSDESWTLKFGRNFEDTEAGFFDFNGRFEVENYLDYQGRKLVERFDANSYLYLTKAMDLHDVARGRGTLAKALGAIRARTLSIGISSDFLYPSYLQKEIAEIISNQGGKANYYEIISPYGHDAFLIEFQELNRLLRDFLR